MLLEYGRFASQVGNQVSIFVGDGEQAQQRTGKLIDVRPLQSAREIEGELELLLDGQAPFRIHQSILPFADIQAIRD